MLADPREMLGLPALAGPMAMPHPPLIPSTTTLLAFSFPGGFYMLLDPKNAKPRQRSALLSPLIQSSGCLSLSFQYTQRGQASGATLMVYASVLGESDKVAGFTLT